MINVTGNVGNKKKRISFKEGGPNHLAQLSTTNLCTAPT